ncbi:thiol-disulfide oxidoreductase [compost metagenome]
MKTTYNTYKLEIIALFLLVLIQFFVGINLYAQSEIKPLKIGESIPDELWQLPLNVLNDPRGKEVVTLEQFKGKLILIDFWGTFCSSCIAGFPKLKVIQENNQDRLKILGISQEEKARLEKFFNSEIGKEYTYISSAYGEKIVRKYFPHRTIPHTIWISPDGKYITPTNNYEITQQNINAIWSNKEVQMLKKVDKDPKKPLLLSDEFYMNKNLHLGFYSLFFQGYYPGYASGSNFKRTTEGKTFGRQMTNKKLIAIVHAIAMHLFEEKKEHFTGKRIISKTRNPYFTDRVKTIPGELPNDQYYSYELIVPEGKADSLYTYMLADLNRYLDVILSFRKQMTNCLVLVRTSKNDKIKSKGGDPSGSNFSENEGKLTIVNQPLVNLLSIMNETSISKLPIIDESAYKGNIDINLTGTNNIDEFRKSLAKYDLDLRPAKRDLLMFIIEDKK